MYVVHTHTHTNVYVNFIQAYIYIYSKMKRSTERFVFLKELFHFERFTFFPL